MMIMSLALFSLLIGVSVCLSVVQADYGITASTNEESFEPGDLVIVRITVTRDSNVAVEIKDPYGKDVFMQSAATEGGFTAFSYRLDDDATEGKYHYYATSVTPDPRDDDFAQTSSSFLVEEKGRGITELPMPDPVVTIVTGSLVFGAVVAISRFHEPLRYLLVSAFLPLYTRIQPKDLEESVVRAQLLGYLRHHPGANYSTIKKDLQFSNGKLTHHLKMLENARRIKSLSHGVNKLFYPRDFQVPNDTFDISPAYGIQRKILDILSHNPSLNQKELVGILGRDRKTISLHLNTLVNRGRIRVERRERENVYTIIQRERHRFDRPINEDEIHY